MIQIVEVRQKALNDTIRAAFCKAAADRFLNESDHSSFMKLLGPISEAAQTLSRVVSFSTSYTQLNLDEIVDLSTQMGGVVVVPVGQCNKQNMQLFYGAWLSN